MQTVFYAGKCSLPSLDKFKATEFDWFRGCLEFYGPFLGEVQKKDRCNSGWIGMLENPTLSSSPFLSKERLNE